MRECRKEFQMLSSMRFCCIFDPISQERLFKSGKYWIKVKVSYEVVSFISISNSKCTKKIILRTFTGASHYVLLMILTKSG